ncbi:lipocalin family protein [Pseudaquabacterium rugosum]|uniref:Outer membrane lipoprotein Blc n=1 Tax=Pseudaquabacterium rugosum TaxID=2984194 RepID=A0ABU9BBD6_9BURK
MTFQPASAIPRAATALLTTGLLLLGACGSTTAPSTTSAATTATAANAPAASPARTPPPRPLPALEMARYLGVWHQVALYPNRFQAQCLDSTTATYSRLDDGRLRVINRCRTARGMDEAEGVARPRDGAVVGADGWLRPASLEVSFLPAALRWTGIGWGRYDVLQLGPDGTWSLVSEPTREYLWVLSRTPTLDAAQWAAIETRLRAEGFDLQRLRREPAAAAAAR